MYKEAQKSVGPQLQIRGRRVASGTPQQHVGSAPSSAPHRNGLRTQSPTDQLLDRLDQEAKSDGFGDFASGATGTPAVPYPMIKAPYVPGAALSSFGVIGAAHRSQQSSTAINQAWRAQQLASSGRIGRAPQPGGGDGLIK